MIAYVDSSVLLRMVLDQDGALVEWKASRDGITSALTEVECLRSLDRLRLRGVYEVAQINQRHLALGRALDVLQIVPLDGTVLKRAAQSFPVPVGSLDAIHLATALMARELAHPELVFATHDKELAVAARLSGFDVIGV